MKLLLLFRYFGRKKGVMKQKKCDNRLFMKKFFVKCAHAQHFFLLFFCKVKDFEIKKVDALQRYGSYYKI